MVTLYDQDFSGEIDQASEVQAIHCDVLWAVNDKVVEQLYSGLLVAYGFGSGFAWAGSLLGFNEAVRGLAEARIRECHIPE